MKITVNFHKDHQQEFQTYQPPNGYSLYQCGEDKQLVGLYGNFRECSYVGCPAVVTLFDNPDTIFTDPWVLYDVVINFTMSLAAIMALHGTSKAMFNRTGIPPRRNIIAHPEYVYSSSATENRPRYDKFRTMVRNTHVGYDDGNYFYPLTLDGNRPPPVKDEKLRPRSINDITIETIEKIKNNYLILPETHLPFFVVCSNVQVKKNPNGPGDIQSISPFAHGVKRNWMKYYSGEDNEIFSFLPFVSKFTPSQLKTKLSWWNKLTEGQKYPNYYRRVST